MTPPVIPMVMAVLLVVLLLPILLVFRLLLVVIFGIVADRLLLVVIFFGAAGGGAAVTPATRRRAVPSALLATDGPGADALTSLDLFGDADLFRTAGVRRVTRATVGTPRRRQELQSTLVSIPGVDRPVTAGLALSDGVPIGRRGHACASEGETTDQEEWYTTPHDDLLHAHWYSSDHCMATTRSSYTVTAISQTHLRKVLISVKSA